MEQSIFLWVLQMSWTFTPAAWKNPSWSGRRLWGREGSAGEGRPRDRESGERRHPSPVPSPPRRSGGPGLQRQQRRRLLHPGPGRGRPPEQVRGRLTQPWQRLLPW